MTAFHDELTLPVTLGEVTRINEFVEKACEEAAITLDARFDLQLAIEEACTNVIEHAYGGAGGQLSVHFEVHNGDVVVTLHDHGQPFDPDSVARPNTCAPLEDRPIGGLGLHLMRRLMDEVCFEFSPEDGNTLTMVKRGVAPGAKKARRPRSRGAATEPPHG